MSKYSIIRHSAKGSTWEEHKYIKRDDGVYYYPDSYKGGRHLSDADKKDSDKNNKEKGSGLEDWEKKIHQHVATIVESHPELFKNTSDISAAILAPANTQAFKNTLKAFGLNPDSMSESELSKVRSKIAGYYSDAVSSAKSGSSKKEDEGKKKDDEKKEIKKVASKGKGKGPAKNQGIARKKTNNNFTNKVRYPGMQHSMDYDTVDYLEHHGILGMKWGVRRYQNKDGSLTSEGRRRLQGIVTYDNKGNITGGDKDKGTANRTVASAAANDFKSASSGFKSGSEMSGSLKRLNEIKSDKKLKKALKKLKISEMSDQELREAVNRMQLEDNFSRLAASRIETGRERTGEILAVAGEVLAMAGTAATIALAISKLKNGG